MKKTRIKLKNVRNALIHLYNVSEALTREQYEIYIAATYVLLSNVPGSELTSFEKCALDNLSSLFSSFPEFVTRTNNKFY